MTRWYDGGASKFIPFIFNPKTQQDAVSVESGIAPGDAIVLAGNMLHQRAQVGGKAMPRRLFAFCFFIAILGLFSANRAQADEVFSWTLPASPAIGSADFTTGVGFEIADVPLSENGALLGNYTFDFFNSSDGGGFDAFVDGTMTILNEFGPQVYKGGESAPTFMAGTFGPFDGQGTLTSGMKGTLHITGAGNANALFTYSVTTPEPSSLLLLGTGALALLSLARKRIMAQRV